jgi:hypothetical protein
MIAETFAPARIIPKKLHMIWVGDEVKRPDSCIETWRRRQLRAAFEKYVLNPERHRW